VMMFVAADQPEHEHEAKGRGKREEDKMPKQAKTSVTHMHPRQGPKSSRR
jgi:hypothetical protein